jgi:hypothetical protein
MSGSPSKITAADYDLVRSLATTQAVAERFDVSLSTAHKHRKRAAVEQPAAAPRPADSAAAAPADGAGAGARQRRPEGASRGGATRQPPPHGSAERDRGGASAHSRVGAAAGGHGPPLTLEPFSPAWAAWYSERRLRSEADWLNDNDARRGIIPPHERRAGERERRSSPGRQRARP